MKLRFRGTENVGVEDPGPIRENWTDVSLKRIDLDSDRSLDSESVAGRVDVSNISFEESDSIWKE